MFGSLESNIIKEEGKGEVQEEKEEEMNDMPQWHIFKLFSKHLLRPELAKA